MKTYWLLCLLLIANSGNTQTGVTARELDKNIIKVDGTICAAKFETTNGEYRRFLLAMKALHPDSAAPYAVDTAAWRDLGTYQETMVMYYYQNPSFDDYPVVNVSHEGARAFCRWLTDTYNSDPKRKHAKIEFFLPDTTQWMQAARGGRSEAMFPWASYYLRDKEGRYLCNMKRVNELNVYRDSTGKVFYAGGDSPFAGSLNDRAFYTANVRSFYPNPFGLFNMSGNVAEMVAEKNISKGGSWNSYAYEVMIGTNWRYRGPNPETGFRVFGRILE